MHALRPMADAYETPAHEERWREQVVSSLLRTEVSITHTLASVYRRAGLSPASFRLLLLLRDEADSASCTQQAVAIGLATSPANLTTLIDRMEAKGWLQRLPGWDRRSNRLQLTPQGAQRLEEVWPHHLKAVEQLAGSLARPEIHQLLHALATLRETARNTPAVSQEPVEPGTRP